MINKLDVHDAELISFERTRGQLVVKLRLWNEDLTTMSFENVFQSREIDCAGATLHLLEVKTDSDYFQEAKHRMNDLGCSEAEVLQLRHFAFVSTDDVFVLELIGTYSEQV